MAPSSVLTAQAVRDLLSACMYEERPDPVPDDTAVAHGVALQIGFDPRKLEEAKPKILEMLRELPPHFFSKLGDTFLNMCVDRNGEQWGEHYNSDQLLVLGLAAGYIRMLPRMVWKLLPGNMPLFTIVPEGGQKGAMTYAQLMARGRETPEQAAERLVAEIEESKAVLAALVEEVEKQSAPGLDDPSAGA